MDNTMFIATDRRQQHKVNNANEALKKWMFIKWKKKCS